MSTTIFGAGTEAALINIDAPADQAIVGITAEKLKRLKALRSFTPEGSSFGIPGSLLYDFRRKNFDQEIKQELFDLFLFGSKNGSWAQDERWNTFYLDAPYNFILLYENSGIGVIGFETYDHNPFWFYQKYICRRENPDNNHFPCPIITIIQIQSTSLNPLHVLKEKSKSVRELAKKCFEYIKWERMLLHFLVGWAFENGFKEVRVQCAKKNKWYNPNDKERCKRMYMRYDITPLRMGFRQSENKDYCFKQKS